MPKQIFKIYSLNYCMTDKKELVPNLTNSRCFKTRRTNNSRHGETNKS